MTRIRYGSIHVGRIGGNSGLHSGDNWVVARTHSAKVSDAVGTVGGRHNSVTETKALIVDDDIVDGGPSVPGSIDRGPIRRE